MSNSIAFLEQITLLLFLMRLEWLDEQAIQEGRPSIYGPRKGCELEHAASERSHPGDAFLCPGHEACRWTSVVGATARREDLQTLLTGFVLPWIRELGVTVRQQDGNGARPGSPGAGIASLATHLADASLTLPRESLAPLRHAIEVVDRLFSDAAPPDSAGEAFGYLLQQIRATRDGGQFWTPPHLVRFMVALVEPQPGESVADPSAGSGGFLVETIQRLRMQATERASPGALRLAWDGTPHGLASPLSAGEDLRRTHLAGFDADPTMARIGWMNLALHGVTDPEFHRLDTLRTRPVAQPAFDVVLTNPPFGGRMEEAGAWFSHRGEAKVVGSRDVLFLKLALEMLRPGGRGAVVVPEGVLFGSAALQVRVREELLFHHLLEGVISLPLATFQPYAGVKTSILVFRKGGDRLSPDQAPRTRLVWFYDVQADGLSHGARRRPQPAPNDLWDALEKWKVKPDTSLDYYQPTFRKERWRTVDARTRKLLDDGVEREDGGAYPVQELFGTPGVDVEQLPPDEWTARVAAEQKTAVRRVVEGCVESMLAGRLTPPGPAVGDWLEVVQSLFREAASVWLEEHSDAHTSEALGTVVADAVREVRQSYEGRLHQPDDSHDRIVFSTWDELTSEIEEIVRAFARLDGWDVLLRSRAVFAQGEPLPASKCWTAPVRRFAFRPDWQSEDGLLQGSHDPEGNPRPEFIADERIYEDAVRSRVKQEYLDPDCIEANGFNLSAVRYRPAAAPSAHHPPPVEILHRLRRAELELVNDLDGLLAMLGEAG